MIMGGTALMSQLASQGWPRQHQGGGLLGGFQPGQLGNLAPFAAGPQMGQQGGGQFAPQGDIGKALGGILGGLGSGFTGIPGLGGIGSQLGSWLPFAAGPQLGQMGGQMGQQGGQQFAPQGDIGAALGGLLGNLGSQFSGVQGLGGIGQQLGSWLPFAAGPQMGQQGGQQQGGQFAPQGDIGAALGGILGGLGSGFTGIPGLGGLGQQLGSWLPFSAGPQMGQQGGQQFAPQGDIGAALGGILGNLGSQFSGIQGLGGIGSQLGSWLPFAAGPQMGQQGGQQGGGQMAYGQRPY
jgi:hypothetical protein